MAKLRARCSVQRRSSELHSSKELGSQQGRLFRLVIQIQRYDDGIVNDSYVFPRGLAKYPTSSLDELAGILGGSNDKCVANGRDVDPFV
jgi:hypothetical protein